MYFVGFRNTNAFVFYRDRKVTVFNFSGKINEFVFGGIFTGVGKQIQQNILHQLLVQVYRFLRTKMLILDLLSDLYTTLHFVGNFEAENFEVKTAGYIVNFAFLYPADAQEIVKNGR